MQRKLTDVDGERIEKITFTQINNQCEILVELTDNEDPLVFYEEMIDPVKEMLHSREDIDYERP